MSASVGRQVFEAILARLRRIDGAAPMRNDLRGRIYAQRPSYDALNGELPAAFVFLANETRGEPSGDRVARERTLTIVGVVRRSTDAGLALEDLLADFDRVLETEDKYLSVDAPKRNLLSGEMTITSSEFELPVDASNVEFVALDVRCRWPHIRGNPDK